ncbi:MAG: response regulator, partial [Candidatus Aminicenantes bacterium]|nr:response regulator [Candidatus Aminicenantes bacterium]
METLIVAKTTAVIQDLNLALESLGHRVFCADTEEQALRILEDHKELRMVFVDSSLDENRGIFFCQKAKAVSSQRYLYVIMVCEQHEKEVASKCLDLGGDDCLSRPFAVGTLQVRLKTGAKIIQLNEKLRDANEVMQIDLLS